MDPLSHMLKPSTSADSVGEDIWEESLFGAGEGKSPTSTRPASSRLPLLFDDPPFPDSLPAGVHAVTEEVAIAPAASSGESDMAEVLLPEVVLPDCAGMSEAQATERRRILTTSSLLRRDKGSLTPIVPEEVPSVFGEGVPMVNVKGVFTPCYDSAKQASVYVSGTLLMTSYQVSFYPDDNSLLVPRDFYYVPLGNILKVDNKGARGRTDSDRIHIWCKDGRSMTFSFNNNVSTAAKVFEIICRFAFSGHSMVFCFAQGEALAKKAKTDPSYAFPSSPDSGWHVYDPVREFSRMGAIVDRPGSPAQWRVCSINHRYGVSPTYPAVLVIPRSISDEVMTVCASFRSKGRMPACSWVHPTNGASITRSSQPKAGMAVDGGARSRNSGDEAVVQAIWSANPNSRRGPLVIADCRPKVNALANRAQGMGYESVENYPNTEILFLDIQNIHVMRDSCNKLLSLCLSQSASSDLDWGRSVEDTAWLRHTRLLLEASMNMARLVEDQRSVFVHCSDGWDRTAQVCCLMEILLDPFYRTYRGFQVLICKEWHAFGHKFQHRTGHGVSNEGDQERAPIFLQFLDCVWQLVRQFPRAFEFNGTMLLEITNHLYSCRFGTFLGDCERERIDIAKQTLSLWTHLDKHQSRFNNPIYVPHGLLLPPVMSVTRNVVLWGDFFLRWAPVPCTMSSSYPAPSHRPVLGHIKLARPSGPAIKFLPKGLSEGANSVGAVLSCDTAATDVEWTLRALINELAELRAKTERCSCGPEGVKFEAKVLELEKEKEGWAAERLALKKLVIELKKEVEDLREASERTDRTAGLWDSDSGGSLFGSKTKPTPKAAGRLADLF